VAGQSEITFQLLDGTQAEVHATELRALRAEECGNDDSFARRFRVLRRQPGFVLAEARHGGYLVGYAFGMPLRPSTSWWRQLTTPLPDEITAEHPGRTFHDAAPGHLSEVSWRWASNHGPFGQRFKNISRTGRAVTVRARRGPGRAFFPSPEARIPWLPSKWGGSYVRGVERRHLVMDA
jgi:hypothetical protein